MQRIILFAILTAAILLDPFFIRIVLATTYSDISAPLLNHMMKTDEDLVVIHVLSNIEYKMLHIEGSINIPIDMLVDSPKLPKDKDTPIVFYCMGHRWLYSKKAAVWAAKAGYTNIYRFAGGIPEWNSFHYPMFSNPEYSHISAKKFTTSEIAEIIKTKDPFILDVRPMAFGKLNEFLKNSYHIPLLELSNNLQHIPKDRKIILTDIGAKLAPVACKFLLKKGYQVLGILRGGLEVWVSEGREVEIRAQQQNTSLLKGDDLE